MDESTKFYCSECEEMLDEVHFDGYLVGDRLLEGVTFVLCTTDKPKCIGVVPGHQSYFKQFNQEYWIKRVEEKCATYDFAECPKCKTDVLIWGG